MGCCSGFFTCLRSHADEIVTGELKSRTRSLRKCNSNFPRWRPAMDLLYVIPHLSPSPLSHFHSQLSNWGKRCSKILFGKSLMTEIPPMRQQTHIFTTLTGETSHSGKKPQLGLLSRKFHADQRLRQQQRMNRGFYSLQPISLTTHNQMVIQSVDGWEILNTCFHAFAPAIALAIRILFSGCPSIPVL